MKYINLIAISALALAVCFTSCKEDDPVPGNPVMNVTGNLGSACFGDNLTFTVKASDADVPLSTIHAELYFGDEMVVEEVIRTKENGADYPVTVNIPYLANIPDGRATLRLTLQNIHFTITEQIYQVSITHPDYPYLTFRAEDGTEYKMAKTAEPYIYSVTERFPADIKGVIVAPKTSDYGREIIFGYENSEIKPDVEDLIPFSNSVPGKYAISFNTFSFEGSPFVTLSLNGQVLEPMDDSSSFTDLTLSKGDVINVEGFPNFSDWWINPDYFLKNDDGSLSFNAYQGTYRIIADMKMQYLRVYKLNGNNPATLNDDGTGALWIIGEGIGHPSLANTVGWTTEKAICMAPVGDKTYQVTLVGGKTVNVSGINFKFFGQMGWGIELTGDDLVSQSDLIGVGNGKNGHDTGNLFLNDGVVLQDNGIYVLTVDLRQGIHDAILTVDYNGEQQFEEKPIYLNDLKMSTSDNANYSTVIRLDQNSKLNFREFTALDELYCDPDYFNFDEDAFEISFLPVSGYYNVKLDKLNGTLSAKRVNEDGSEMTLQADGTGALWLMGWGVGSPSQSYQFGWTPGASYCMAEVKPGVFQFTGQAGPETGSVYGDRFRYDYLSFKFFGQDGWGTEFGAGSLAVEGDVTFNPSGNFELSGMQLTQGATYRLTVDFTKGTDAGVMTMIKL